MLADAWTATPETLRNLYKDSHKRIYMRRYVNDDIAEYLAVITYKEFFNTDSLTLSQNFSEMPLDSTWDNERRTIQKNGFEILLESRQGESLLDFIMRVKDYLRGDIEDFIAWYNNG